MDKLNCFIELCRKNVFGRRVFLVFLLFISASICFFFGPSSLQAQTAKTSVQQDWEKAVEAAKKEGKVVVSIPASAELRKQLEDGFRKRFDLDVEVFTARGSAAVRKMADEFRAGVRHFDLHIGGSSSAVSGLLDEAILDPVENWLVLTEVNDPKQWWGGHVWVDRSKKFIYSSMAYLSETIWYNTDLVKPAELRSYDDLLNPKWKGKIGFLDPRTPGAGDSNWSFIWATKGEEYLKKLAAHDLLLGRDQRLLAENLARGKVAIMIGLTYYSYLPFVKASLPITPLPVMKEGTYATGGSGNLAIIRNPPHPNATRVFVNWVLGREGQDLVSRALGQGTRRLDVDTKWLRETGVTAAKDQISVKEYFQIENQSEEKLDKVRDPALKVAHDLLR
jgi:ABC-type Fe3+ transport system substrate-binding protein